MIDVLLYIAALIAIAMLFFAGALLLQELRRSLEDEDISDSEGGPQ